MNPKTKMKIRTAIADYVEMFPDDWKQCQIEIEYQKQNLKNEMAEIDGSYMVQRALFSIPALLSTMIAKKLDTDELNSFKEKTNARWFAKEFPQFRITKEI